VRNKICATICRNSGAAELLWLLKDQYDEPERGGVNGSR
jgi:hypothetical protein